MRKGMVVWKMFLSGVLKSDEYSAVSGIIHDKECLILRLRRKLAGEG
jgi:hypothetical protein